MSAFTLRVDNLRGLRQVRWTLDGVRVLIGANGAGKSTVLLALQLLHTALDRGLPEATRIVLGGSQGLKHRDALDEEPVELGIDLDDLQWRVRLSPREASVDYRAEESLRAGERLIYRRDALGNFEVLGERWSTDERLGLKAVLDAQRELPEVERMAAFLRSISVFHDPALVQLRGGSHAAHTKHLHSRGLNALTMLRLWNEQRPDRHRFRFVLTGLQAAFPGLIEDLDFEVAGSTVAARVYRPGHELPDPLANEANGVLAMLVALCALAAAEDGGVVALDEVGNALHPFALRVLARRAEHQARQRGLTVILATHNTVLLDHFDGQPERVHVLDRTAWPGPVALPELRNPKWLRQFRLGELYADGELGSNDDLGGGGPG